MDAKSIIGALLASPLPFAALGGIFVGMALSRATRRIAGSRDPSRARTRKWVAFCIYLSLAVVLGILAVFLPGARKIADVRVAYVAGAAAIVSFAGTRFRLALGIPIAVILIVAVTAGALFLRSVRAFTGETTIATVRVISADQDSMRLQLLPRDGEPGHGHHARGVLRACRQGRYLRRPLGLPGRPYLVPVRRADLLSHGERGRQLPASPGLDGLLPSPSRRHLGAALVLLRGKRAKHPGREDGADRDGPQARGAGRARRPGAPQLRDPSSERRRGGGSAGLPGLHQGALSCLRVPRRMATEANLRHRKTTLSPMETTTMAATMYSRMDTTVGSPIQGTPSNPAISAR